MIKRTLSGFRAAASERIKRLNADPEFAAAASERMKRLRADPAFEMKRVAGLRRRRKTYSSPIPDWVLG
jgi:hypothetical protein